MREYETIIVMRPDSPESQAKELLDKVGNIIERKKGVIFQLNNWGRKELSYRIEKYNQGIYHYYNYAAEADAISEIERMLKLNDLPIRFLTVKLCEKVDVEARKKEIAEAKVEQPLVRHEDTENVEESGDEEVSYV